MHMHVHKITLTCIMLAAVIHSVCRSRCRFGAKLGSAVLLLSLILLAAANFIGAPLWAVTLAAAVALVAGNYWQHYVRPWMRRRKGRRREEVSSQARVSISIEVRVRVRFRGRVGCALGSGSGSGCSRCLRVRAHSMHMRDWRVPSSRHRLTMLTT